MISRRHGCTNCAGIQDTTLHSPDSAVSRFKGMLISFRRGLAASGLARCLVEAIEAHADRIVEAAWHGTHFDLDDIPDGALLLVTVREGGGPERVPADHFWTLLPPIPQDNTAPK